MTALISDSVLKAIENGLLGLILALGLACAVVFVWRWRAVRSAGLAARPWRQRLADDWTLDATVMTLPKSPDQGEAGAADRLVRLGLDQAGTCPEALEKLLVSQERRERQVLERGAQFLGTVGANAPFLGLTGTVLGILSAFRRMAEQGGSGGVEVMSAIAGALIATAAGLLVAIPAVVLYNLLKAAIKRTMEDLAEIRDMLLARSLQATSKEVF